MDQHEKEHLKLHRDRQVVMCPRGVRCNCPAIIPGEGGAFRLEEFGQGVTFTEEEGALLFEQLKAKYEPKP
jgi:hypothetical protein